MEETFKINAESTKSKARTGVISTYHGQIKTPIFMPVGTLATVKGVFQQHLASDVNAEIILGNTYHLFLKPGVDVIERAGGLHKFMGWEKPILTDSGGYQIFSLSANRKLTEEGAFFKSHIDGSKQLFTPENVVDTQFSLGADFIMALDECTSYPCDIKTARKSMELTHRWLERGVKYYRKKKEKYGYNPQFLPIVQGSMYADLRKESAEFITQQDLTINAIGGLSVGEPEEEMYQMCSQVTDILPINKPRYLMGVGTPSNLLNNIALGIDMFDCVMPTRNGRNGMLFTWDGVLNIKNQKWKYDFSFIDTKGKSFVDKFYTKAYLRHLFAAKEMLGPQIASLHNLSFYLDLVTQARKNIEQDTFEQWKEKLVPVLNRRL